MSGRPVSFPVRYGRGLQRVSLYAPTTALPYYRITYRTGGKRLQRTYTCLEKPTPPVTSGQTPIRASSLQTYHLFSTLLPP
jgi:hypothetical protein